MSIHSEMAPENAHRPHRDGNDLGSPGYSVMLESDRHIIGQFPELFDLQSGPSQSAMTFGFQLNGSGGLVLLYRLCEKLQLIALELRTRGIEFKILQIKQKLGTLRMAHRGGNDAIQAEIDRARAVALRTCELCGKPGELRSEHGYLIVLCRGCFPNKIFNSGHSVPL